MEAQECRATKTTGKMTMSGMEFWVTPRTAISHSTFVSGDLTSDSYYSNGVLELPGGHKIGGQATKVVYKITVMEEYAKLNDLTGVNTVASVIMAKAADLSQADTVAGSTC